MGDYEWVRRFRLIVSLLSTRLMLRETLIFSQSLSNQRGPSLSFVVDLHESGQVKFERLREWLSNNTEPVWLERG